MKSILAAQMVVMPMVPAFAETLDGNNWDLVRGVQIEEVVTETSYQVKKTFPEAIKDGAVDFELTGYVVTTYNNENVKEFILVSDMGFCPYCGDPDHGASIPVNLAFAEDKMEDGARITLRGILETNLDAQTWQSLSLSQARIIS